MDHPSLSSHSFIFVSQHAEIICILEKLSLESLEEQHINQNKHQG